LSAALAAVADARAALNPDDLSPREAFEALYRLKLWRRSGSHDFTRYYLLLADGQCVY